MRRKNESRFGDLATEIGETMTKSLTENVSNLSIRWPKFVKLNVCFTYFLISPVLCGLTATTIPAYPRYIKGSGYSDWSESSNTVIQCGTKGDIPVAGDYLGDGEITVAVWGPSNGNWYLKGKPMTSNWGSSSVNLVIQCGCAGDVPVPQDYFNEGKLRIAVWRPSNGNWYIKGVGMASWGQSGGNLAVQCGMAGDIPVPGDYYGDGIVRIAVWRPSNGVWYIKGTGTADWAHTNGNVAIQCGCKGDIPAPYDFFNEGKVRIAVFRPTTGKFYIKGDGMQDWGSSSGNIVFPGGDLLVHQIPVNFYS